MRPTGACAEEGEERINVSVLRVHLDLVESKPIKQLPTTRISVRDLRGEGLPHQRM